MRAPARILLLLTLATVAATLGVSPAAPAYADSGAWSTTLLRNGDFSGGDDGWEQSRFSFLTDPAFPLGAVEGDPAMAAPLFAESESFASDCTGVGGRQIIDIDDQVLEHTLRLRWRMRVSGVTPREAGLAISVGSTDSEFSIYTSFNFETARWEAAQFFAIGAESWREAEVEFSVRHTEPVADLTIDFIPMINTAGGDCGRGARVFLDDVALESLVVPDLPGGDSIPRLEDLTNTGTSGATELINRYRGLTGAHRVTYDAAASAGARAHAHYMAINGEAGNRGHFEDPSLPGFTEAGDEAARTARLCGGSASLAACVESLYTVPYHRFGLLLEEEGFGRWELQLGFEDGNGVVGFLDDIEGSFEAYLAAQGAARAGPRTPAIWPRDGLNGVPGSIELRENPDPLFLCSGAPADKITGYPITVEVPFAVDTNSITNATGALRDASGRAVPLCRVDAQQPHPQHTAILAPGSPAPTFPGKMIFIPLMPLEPGTEYTFSLSAIIEGTIDMWSATFSTRGVPPLIAASAPVESDAFSIALRPGWNLVGWTGESSDVLAATAGISGAFSGFFTWDAITQAFLTFNPSLPASLNTLSQIQFGNGVWLFVTASGTIVWEQPEVTAAQSVELRPGFNLVTWTGPNGAAVAEAVTGLGSALDALFLWDAAGQRYRSFNPSLPASLNTATAFNHRGGIWIKVNRSVIWEQPAP